MKWRDDRIIKNGLNRVHALDLNEKALGVYNAMKPISIRLSNGDVLVRIKVAYFTSRTRSTPGRKYCRMSLPIPRQWVMRFSLCQSIIILKYRTCFGAGRFLRQGLTMTCPCQFSRMSWAQWELILWKALSLRWCDVSPSFFQFSYLSLSICLDSYLIKD